MSTTVIRGNFSVFRLSTTALNVVSVGNKNDIYNKNGQTAASIWYVRRRRKDICAKKNQNYFFSFAFTFRRSPVPFRYVRSLMVVGMLIMFMIGHE